MTTQDVVNRLSDGMTWAQAASCIGLLCLVIAAFLGCFRWTGKLVWGLVKTYWYYAYRHKWRRPSPYDVSARGEAVLTATCVLLGIAYVLT